MFHDDSFADIAVDLEKTMPLKGDKAKSTVCFAYQSGSCLKGDRCPHKHTITHRSRVLDEVCKYWLRGLCKMGEDCEFLHEHIASKIPECFFYQGFGECSNPECVFRHNSMDEAIPECQAYRRGFCRYGPKCRLRHVKRDACPNYMAGLCIDGPDCRMGHPSTLHITEDGIRDRLSKRRAIVEGGVRSYVFTSSVNCSVCGCNGHGAAQCSQNATRVAEIKRDIMRKYEEPEGIGCYHCKTEGHLSNDCTKKKERYMQHRHRDEPAESLIPGVQGTRADLNQEAERARPRCHRCGEEGHIVRDCPLAKAEQAQGKAAPGQRVITVCSVGFCVAVMSWGGVCVVWRGLQWQFVLMTSAVVWCLLVLRCPCPRRLISGKPPPHPCASFFFFDFNTTPPPQTVLPLPGAWPHCDALPQKGGRRRQGFRWIQQGKQRQQQRQQRLIIRAVPERPPRFWRRRRALWRQRRRCARQLLWGRPRLRRAPSPWPPSALRPPAVLWPAQALGPASALRRTACLLRRQHLCTTPPARRLSRRI